MKVHSLSNTHDAGNIYSNLNQVCGGKLFPLLEEIGKRPLPENYTLYKDPQRRRVGRGLIENEYHWSLVPAQRSAKAGSQLGEAIVQYLNQVELDTNGPKALAVEETLKQQLGQIVYKAMLKQPVTALPGLS